MSNSESPYTSLPKEICQIGHLINLEPGISKKKPEEVIDDWLPKNNNNNKNNDEIDFKYKTYSLYEQIEQNKSRKCNKKKLLNSKQRKALFNLNTEQLDYKKFIQINKLWHSYFESILLDEIKTKSDEIKLARIDLHGSYLIVCKSKNPSIIGTKGFMIQESKNMFRILNEHNKLLEIPKHGTIFAFKHNDKLYKINGYNIMMSSYNRSKAKPKMNFICDL